MAQGVLGLGKGASSLNQGLLDKLRKAESKAKIDPIEARIKAITEEGGESDQLIGIKTKLNAFLEAVKPFDLFASGANAFEQKTASASGKSALFDVLDIAALNAGSTNVDVKALAQRDVYQSGKIFDKDSKILGSNSASDTLIISHKGKAYTFDTNGKSYKDLVTDINHNSNFLASMEEVSTGEYRLVIKSKEPGLDNAITITENGNLDLGLNNKTYATSDSYVQTDIPGAGTLNLNGETFSLSATQTYQDLVNKINASSNFNAHFEKGKVVISRTNGADLIVNKNDFNFNLGSSQGGKILNAANMEATVDGINYNVSSNSLTVGGGLKITAVELGKSSVSVQEDTTSLTKMMKDFISKYNDLRDSIDEGLYSSDSKIKDKSTLRNIIDKVSNLLYNSYGDKDTLNVFNFGFELNKSGRLSLDEDKFTEATKNNAADLKSLFLGLAEKEGLGTKLKTYVDSLDGYNGAFSIYEDKLLNRKQSLEKEKKEAIEDLDRRYASLAQQFADYGNIINQFESQFAGLKLMIQQSTAS